MEILSSGSFINLENQEKIEQLKFTATELANAAIESDGFVNEEEPAKKLALEFWQGLEYMCRESEQAKIQNIFLNHFLERLRELRAPVSTVGIVSANESQIETSAAVEIRTNSEDEFLGVIETDEAEIEAEQPFTEEISIQTEDSAATENDLADDVEIETAKSDLPEPEDLKDVADDEVETSDSETDIQAKPIESSFGLPEKEPYQFNKCTVTVAIQLLPAQENFTGRKAVLSVRTHDFAPNISLVELTGNSLTHSLMPELEKVLATYKSDLPLKVMDKMKKEKTTAKRNAPKPNSEAKTVSQTAATQGEVSSAQTTESEATQTTTTIIPQTAQTGLQGSLFGF